MSDSRFTAVRLDERTLIPRKPDDGHERAAAVHDLLADNRFDLKEQPGGGPYTLMLSVINGRLVFEVRDWSGELLLGRVAVPLIEVRAVVRDYLLIRESYHDAVRRSTPSQVDAIGTGRRGLLDDGAAFLSDAFAELAELDTLTAERLFTLLCALHLRP